MSAFGIGSSVDPPRGSFGAVTLRNGWPNGHKLRTGGSRVWRSRLRRSGSGRVSPGAMTFRQRPPWLTGRLQSLVPKDMSNHAPSPELGGPRAMGLTFLYNGAAGQASLAATPPPG